MKTIENIKVPTGNILITHGEKGPLECLSIGDYGKEKNLKADFMGLKKEINGVPHGDLLPLEKKWVITISTQYGCSMNCTFCDVPKVGPGVNATRLDMVSQATECISLHPEIKHTDRLNLHFARMGEPTFNPEVLKAARQLKGIINDSNGWGFHPVVSTMCPSNNKILYDFIWDWLQFKNKIMNGDAGLQLSINTTDEKARKKMFSGNALTLEEISSMFERLLSDFPFINQLMGRKIALNFALTGNEIDAKKLRKLFTPGLFLCKITPMHLTDSCIESKIITQDGYNYYYPYRKIEEDLKNEGFDVIVFIPSEEEDESKITCGNITLMSKIG